MSPEKFRDFRETGSRPEIFQAFITTTQSCEDHSIHSSNLHEFHVFIIYGLVIHQYNDQLPVDLVAELAEHWIGIAEVRVQVLFRAEFFLAVSHYYLNDTYNCKNNLN